MEKLDLKSLVKEHPSCMESRAKLRATLMDCYPKPEYKRDINTVLIIYESGMLRRIQGKDRLEPHETAAMCAKIENEYGIPPEVSVKAIIAWGEVWGTSVSAAIAPAPKAVPATALVSATEPTIRSAPEAITPMQDYVSKTEVISPVRKPIAKPIPKPVTSVQTSANEYAIKKRKEGWIIYKFQGFGQENMTIPNIIDGKSIIGLEGGIFKGCKGIRNVIISEGIRFLWGNETGGIFESCSLEQVQLPSTLEEIGSACFELSGLKSITIHAGITRIGIHAFFKCDNLISVSISNGVTYIGDSAFEDCRNLTSINIPDTVIEIGKSAFSGCFRLSSIVFPKHLKKVSSKVCFCCVDLSNVVISEECQSIERSAFRGCKKIKEVQIPPGVVSIGVSAFESNTGVIYCAPGSVAMKYARENGITCFTL